MEANTFKYDNVRILEMNKQISLTMPEKLFDELKKATKKAGHRTSQEYILQMLREDLLLKDLDRIHAEMKAGKNSLHFKSVKEFKDFLRERYGSQKKRTSN